MLYPDVARASGVAATTQSTDAAEVADPHFAFHAGTGRQLDRDVDRLATELEDRVVLPGAGSLNQQPAVGELNAGLLRRLHVGLLGSVVGGYGYNGVGALAGTDSNVGDIHRERDGDWLGGLEGLRFTHG